VPARNKSDLVDLPEEVESLLEIKQVETIDEVLELALLAPDERARLSGGVRVMPDRPQPGARP
jgi:ATP-dependent Lon protease